MATLYTFKEHTLSVVGEEQDLRDLAEHLKDAEGTLGDLRYQIEYAFDIDGIRTSAETPVSAQGHHCILCGAYIDKDHLQVCDKCASEYKF